MTKHTDEDRVLRDGERLHVSMIMMDSLQRAIATDPDMRRARDSHSTVVDAFGDSGLALNKPGSRYLTAGSHTLDHALQVTREFNRQEAFNGSVAALQDAWRGDTSDREVPRLHNTGNPVADAWLDSVADLENAWHRGSGKR